MIREFGGLKQSTDVDGITLDVRRLTAVACLAALAPILPICSTLFVVGAKPVTPELLVALQLCYARAKVTYVSFHSDCSWTCPSACALLLPSLSADMLLLRLDASGRHLSVEQLTEICVHACRRISIRVVGSERWWRPGWWRVSWEQRVHAAVSAAGHGHAIVLLHDGFTSMRWHAAGRSGSATLPHVLAHMACTA